MVGWGTDESRRDIGRAMGMVGCEVDVGWCWWCQVSVYGEEQPAGGG